MSVLGAMLLGDRSSIEKATEALQREDFYRDAHGRIYEAMVTLAERDEPVDIVTLKDELDRRGILDAVGGISYLIQLGEFVPTTANIAYYAKIVADKAVLRRLIEASGEIAGLAYGQSEEVDTLTDLAERMIFNVARRRRTQGFTPLKPLLTEVFDRIDTLYHERGVTTGIDTGFTDLNYITSGFQPGDLVIIAARPSMGKTALTLNIGQNAALRAEKSVAVFSLEMSKESLVQRMICSEARVDAHRLRTGFLSEEDWSRLAQAVDRLWNARLYIDDTTDVSSLEMRAKCRRLRAEYGLDMVIVDYLQLMRGSSRSGGMDNRNNEITEIARGLKNLARELEVPVIALSQLSRAVEKREDKRPMLSDLRDCLATGTRLICAETGRLIPIEQAQPGQRILSMDRAQRSVCAEVTQVWNKGIQPVYRVVTETGREIRCTGNHPFLTATGYKPLLEIAAGARVATSWRLPRHGSERPERADLCRFLGYLAGDGHMGKHRTISFISADRETYDDAKAIVTEHFPEISFTEEVHRRKNICWEVDFVAHHSGRHGKPGGNPLINWLKELGILGQLCDTKRVAEYVLTSGEVGACEFLRGYLATDGCVKQTRGRWFVHFDTVSYGLARDVQHLLLKIGVVGTIQSPQRKNGIYKPIYRININPQSENLRRFTEKVQPIGKKGELLRVLLKENQRETTNPGVFVLPEAISVQLAEKTKHLKQQGRKLPEGQRLYWKNQGKGLRRDIAALWADRLGDQELSLWSHSDVLWEQIRSIDFVGEEETFDICVPETGCFIAEGCVVHNSGSIEAEADVVGFIYRPSYYARKEAISQEGEEKAEAERGEGEYSGEEAEVIIAKQRNGPTGTVKLSFLPKFARFENLAQNLEGPDF